MASSILRIKSLKQLYITKEREREGRKEREERAIERGGKSE